MAPTVGELAIKVDELYSMFKELQRDRQEDVECFVKRKAEQAEAYTKRIRVLESCLNETKDSSIQSKKPCSTPESPENSLKASVPSGPKLFKGSEDPLTHIKTFEEQMFINGVPSEQWPTTFPYSLGPAPAAWFSSQIKGIHAT